MEANLRLEKKILNISFVGSSFFLIAEIILMFFTRSNAIFMDCVYDVADIVMIGPFLLLIPLLYKPETETKPYGFSQVESLFILLKSGILIGVTVFLIYESISTIIAGGNHVDASLIAGFELMVSVICIIMYLSLSKMSKNYSTPSIKAELYIWKLDAMSTMGVGLAFVIMMLLSKTGLAFIGPYLDPVIAIILAVLLLKEPIGLFVEAVKNLVLFAPDKETNEKIRKICEKHLENVGCYVNFLDIIKTGRKIWVEVYFVTSKDLISIEKLKVVHKELFAELDSEFDSIFVELIPDVDEVKVHNLIKMKNSRRPDKLHYIEKVENKKHVLKKS